MASFNSFKKFPPTFWKLYSRTDFRTLSSASLSVENSASIGSNPGPWRLRNLDNGHLSNNYLDALGIGSDGWTWDLNNSSSVWGNQNEFPMAYLSLQNLATTELQNPGVPIRIVVSLDGLGQRNHEAHGIGIYADEQVTSNGINTGMVGAGFVSGTEGAVIWGYRTGGGATLTVLTSPRQVYADCLMIEVENSNFRAFYGYSEDDGSPPRADDKTKWFADYQSGPNPSVNAVTPGFGTVSNTRTLYFWAQNSNTSNAFAPIFKVLEIWYAPNFTLY